MMILLIDSEEVSDRVKNIFKGDLAGIIFWPDLGQINEKTIEDLNMNRLTLEVEKMISSFNEEKFNELVKLSSGTYNFNHIMAELASYDLDDELDALSQYLEIMRDRGFIFSNKDDFLAGERGSLQRTKLDRIQNYRKGFFVNQIRDELRKVHKYIKSKTRQ